MDGGDGGGLVFVAVVVMMIMVLVRGGLLFFGEIFGKVLIFPVRSAPMRWKCAVFLEFRIFAV